ncbi:MAG: serpin family protein [Spirosomataceae bacterium]|jgi:serine protease inhibitor
MKKSITLFCLSAIIILTTMNCSNVVNPIGRDVEIPVGFSNKTTAFAFDFWKELNSNEDKNKSYFVSPLSLHIALGMLLNGADGQTKAEIQSVLKTNDLTDDELNTIYSELIANLPKADPKVTNTIANSIWQRQGFPVEEAFIRTLKQTFNAQHYTKDFSQPATLNAINGWASDNTNGKVKKILDEISNDQVMFLINALYFKGDWKHPFDKKSTYKTTFSGVSGNNETDMMQMTKELKYAATDSYQAVELPYGSDRYVMTVILPNGESTDNVVNGFSSANWEELAGKLQEQKVIIGLPKFKMEYSKKLNDVLISMGMPSAFSSAADLSKISPPAGKIKVGFVKQDAFLAVDEVGTEAAAVTTIGIELTSVPNYPTVICNRPFLFTISERTSNTIMFVGKIVNL